MVIIGAFNGIHVFYHFIYQCIYLFDLFTYLCIYLYMIQRQKLKQKHSFMSHFMKLFAPTLPFSIIFGA